MTDQQLVTSSRRLVVALNEICAKRRLDADDRTALASMALAEFLAQSLGPLGAVDRLRAIAETLEGQINALMA